MEKVTKYTRAGKDGKIIKCPTCAKTILVYHFQWSAIACSCCKSEVEKADWLIGTEEEFFTLDYGFPLEKFDNQC